MLGRWPVEVTRSKKREEEGILKQLWDKQKSEKGGEEEDQEGQDGIEKENSEED